MVELKIRF